MSSSSSTSSYDAVRASMASSAGAGSDDATSSTAFSEHRVEVNQRALIDKILARYASAGAVYRELLQNSNDAEASVAEIEFTVSDVDNIVQQVVYRNNGMPFRPQDWSRLQKIAEGNPDVSKVGAFGVGAYTMFSICEEPMVVSGTQVLMFFWKGDALWSKVGPWNKPTEGWTTFVLKSRDPYPLPDWTEFGQFLCASLTFTQCLKTVRVRLNGQVKMELKKTTVQEPRLVEPPKSTSWWKNDGAVTVTPRGIFSLKSGDIWESQQQMTVTLEGQTSSILARYVSGVAKTRISSEMARKMQRVTKKQPPPEVTVQIVLAGEDAPAPKNSAQRITNSFKPQLGKGRVFIGFRTSQTTGLAAHLAAPLLPTVEREAIDLQDPTLRVYNTELLECCGIVLRLTLEHSMLLVGVDWLANTQEREALKAKLLKEQATKKKEDTTKIPENAKKPNTTNEEGGGGPKTDDSSRSFFSFAKFMAKGVAKGVVSVLNTVESVLEEDTLLNPKDPLPLSKEERQAILLMRSFCPQQSTPDSQVGTALAQGFSRCMPQSSPPVLTLSGVVRGNEGKLPNQGAEAFCETRVIRRLVFENAREYHEVLCDTRKLTIDDLLESIAGQILTEEKLIRLIQWWNRFVKANSQYATYYKSKGPYLKDAVRFLPAKGGGKVLKLQDFLYYVEDKSLQTLPLPETALPIQLQEKIGIRVLTSSALTAWFSDLPVDIWSQFIAMQPCMTQGQPEDEKLRLQVLSLLCKEWQRKNNYERRNNGRFLQQLLGDRLCLPFDSSEPTQFAAGKPTELYLNSAELKAFDGLGSNFQKVSASLKDHGVTDEFLLQLGVRKSVNIDFLFTNLNSLRWSEDPKPLVEYLRTATLSTDDAHKLRMTQYLPAENDVSRTFAPKELYLPKAELRLFPFVKILQWPSEDELTERSANGKFLIKLGSKVSPPLLQLLRYISQDVKDDQLRIKCLNYVVKNLGPGEVYENEYNRMKGQTLSQYRILPCLSRDPFGSVVKKEIVSPNSCYSSAPCQVMGFSVLDPEVNSKSGNLYGTRFKCLEEPDKDLLLSQLMHLVSTAKSKLSTSKVQAHRATCHQVIQVFDQVFEYLSSRTNDFDSQSLKSLQQQRFIPSLKDDAISWYEPSVVYFKSESGDTLTESLFHVVEFSPFLAAAGVKTEATTQDLFRLMLKDPNRMLNILGSEEKYRKLLRRIAANPPFRNVTQEIRDAPFLLAYKIVPAEESGKEDKRSYLLAKADDIFIIDNSFFGRMFPVIRAPAESDLENFYVSLGSKYISKKVSKKFEIIGSVSTDTVLCQKLNERLQERRPLLVSPSVTSRPLVKNASALLDAKNLKLMEADDLKVIYALGKSVRNQRITCCARSIVTKKNGLYVTGDFDWFDVGYAIGGLILQRCQLEDAFFIGSILEVPLEQLRSRGFPVDRILTPPEPEPELLPPVPTKPPPPPPSQPPSQPTMVDVPLGSASAGGGGGKAGNSATPQAIPPSTSFNQKEPRQQQQQSEPGMGEILKNMFPDCDESYIESRLGQNASVEKVRELANEMATGAYPKKRPGDDNDNDNDDDDATVSTIGDRSTATQRSEQKEKEKKKMGKKLSKAFSGLRNVGSNITPSVGNRIRNAAAAGAAAGTMNGPGGSPNHVVNDGQPVSPAVDTASQAGMEQLLKNSVNRSAKVNARGVSSSETVMTQLPEGLARNSEGCEVIPGQSLKPFAGPYRSNKTHNGIRVFSARSHPSSEQFLEENFHAVDTFANVLRHLCQVYDLQLSSVAIFHDPTGGTIAFNANRALHFNVRFFYALHYQTKKQSHRDCYSYWFTTMAHELAHHLVSAHNKEHGYYTESYVTLYLPKLVSLLTQLEQSQGGGANLRSKFG